MTLRKVYMLPTPSAASRDTTNSINQIVLYLAKHLPKYGWELVEHPNQADVVAGHAGQTSGEWGCDVVHCHGLYPTGLFPEYQAWWGINVQVIENLRRAKAITAPSRWVADILQRNLNVPVNIIPWAIEFDEWNSGKRHDYVLWNKTREDSVCDPSWVKVLYEQIPEVRIVTTFYPDKEIPDTVKVIGRIPYLEMKETIKGAALYLATTKETFGIGILEAMACGIPILGFNWGAIPEFVQHGVHGFLAEPGDEKGLIDGWHYCMQHRKVLGQNARDKASEFSWDKVARGFAQVYDEVYIQKVQEASESSVIEVSVIIPSHNYSKYLPEAIKSVLHQETSFNYEIIVVDDASTDESAEIADNLLHMQQGMVLRNSSNLGVAKTRNRGIEAASGKYIVCLDADDMFGSSLFLQTLYGGIVNSPELGIVYSGLGLLQEDESGKFIPSQWPSKFDANAQFRGHNQIPTCCMFRKEAWRRAGGYKFYAEPSEDGELWTRIIALGYDARQVTSEPIFYYRWHENSLSSDIRSGRVEAVNWLYTHSWAVTGNHLFASRASSKKASHAVFNYDKPYVSIIIPVADYHEEYLVRALDSVWAQTYSSWECIVVNDTGKPLKTYSWVKVIDTFKESSKKGRGSAAISRNLGLQEAKGSLVTFLDADDFFSPDYLDVTVKAYHRTGRYIYTDWVSLKKDGSREIGKASTYDIKAVFNSHILHTVSILIPLSWAKAVGGFDSSMSAWEDVELFMNLASHGFCGHRVDKPLIYYDYSSGKLREKSLEHLKDLRAYLFSKYGKFMGEDAEVCQCSETKPQMSRNELLQAAKSGDMIRVVYLGARAKMTFIGPATRQNYGRRQYGDTLFVWKEDFEALPNLLDPAPLINSVQIAPTEIPPEPSRKGVES